MSIRTPESLLCGHCQSELATATCVGCKLQICTACTHAWHLCERPVAVEFALDAGGQLIAIDPDGTLGLVEHRRRRHRTKYRLIDLRTGRETDLPFPAPAGHLRDSGQLVAAQSTPVTALGHGRWRTPGGLVLDDSHRGALNFSERKPTARILCQYDVHNGHAREIHYQPAGPMSYDRRRRYRVSCRSTQTDVCITDLATGTLRIMATAPRDVITSVAYDPDTGLLVAGCWGQIYLFTERNHTFGPPRHITIADSDIRWLASARRRVVASCHRGRLDSLAVVDIPDRGPPGRVRTVPVPTPGLTDSRSPCIDVSPDGCHLALALRDHSVAMLQLPAPMPDQPDRAPWSWRLTTLHGHDSALRLLSFTRDGALLISADDDGRIIIRPHLENRPV